MELKTEVAECIARLLDNYEWQDNIEYDDWLRLQEELIFTILGSSEGRITAFISLCRDNGVIEGD